MCSLKSYKLWTSNTIDQNKVEELIGHFPNIEEFQICAHLSYFNLDRFYNLKSLYLVGTLNEDFNFEILKNLCIQLEYFAIFFTLEDANKCCDESILNLLNGLRFPNLTTLCITNCNMRTIKKKFIRQFPMLRELSIRKCNLEMIEDDAFSNMKQLVSLDLYGNLLVTLKPHYFSELINLEYLELSDNRIESIEKNVFSNLKNLRELDLSNNKLSILDRELFIGVPNSEIFLDGNNSDFDYLFDDLNINNQTRQNV